jgi:uncharacterized membrane protein (DUF373 family)
MPERVARDVREWFASAFTRVEDFVYLGLGVLLAVSAVALLITGAVDLARTLLGGELATRVVALLDQILLILMIVEILYTVQVSFREHTLAPQPFLIVGLIAVMRRLLVLTAEFAERLDQGDEAFRNGMLELALLAVMVLILVAAIVILHKRPGAVAQRS